MGIPGSRWWDERGGLLYVKRRFCVKTRSSRLHLSERVRPARRVADLSVSTVGYIKIEGEIVCLVGFPSLTCPSKGPGHVPKIVLWPSE
ncbi:hypothetical protein EVAR_43699_1 [Eumeta japonica]|uniref:Uncharacterized protein n=1 Tax=Eumeta variegata TaxID=151549 RepID=A0A4C1X0R0_EUMVA|nr:hypothetical protein EVAR_43699_1 [Eumeta japonica]